ncbi:MAG: hypothetical protein JXM79_00395 [Sedimentisphaerales bacterium]|nr:hypothetical protein [Sedimentisphaerales bacterium]
MKKKTGTREWAVSTVNIQRGCENNCRYCYARYNAVQRFKRCTLDQWRHPAIDPAKVEKAYGQRDGVVMFPSAHDITLENVEACYTVLEKLLESGNQVLIVTKPRWRCVTALCDCFREYRDRILWRMTIGSIDDEVLRFWEPNAPGFEERWMSLKYAFICGFNTSVSCEPYLDDQVELTYQKVLPFVRHSVWIGILRHFESRVDLTSVTDEQFNRYIVPLRQAQTKLAVRRLVERMADYPLVMFKDSIRTIIDK